MGNIAVAQLNDEFSGYKQSSDELGSNGAGQGVSEVFFEAPNRSPLTADQNRADAQYLYGLSLCTGSSGRRDFVEAAKSFKLAADQNHAKGQYEYGLCFWFGQGVRKDLVEAAQYFKLAADQNCAEAQYKYGDCFWCGQGVRKDLVEAAKYFKLAADQNHAGAQSDCCLNILSSNVDDAEEMLFSSGVGSASIFRCEEVKM
jgi:TPR repeat protein